MGDQESPTAEPSGTARGPHPDDSLVWLKSYTKNMPLFVFYFDGLDSASHAACARAVQHYGARVEQFFSNHVTHIVSSRVPGSFTMRPAAARHDARSRSISESSQQRLAELYPEDVASVLASFYPEDAGMKNPFLDPNDILAKAFVLKQKVWPLFRLDLIMYRLAHSGTRPASARACLGFVKSHWGATPEQDASAKNQSLGALLQEESRPADMHTVKDSNYYVLIEDTTGEHRPVIFSEYALTAHPATKKLDSAFFFNPALDVPWPVPYGGSDGRTAFSKPKPVSSQIRLRQRHEYIYGALSAGVKMPHLDLALFTRQLRLLRRGLPDKPDRPLSAADKDRAFISRPPEPERPKPSEKRALGPAPSLTVNIPKGCFSLAPSPRITEPAFSLDSPTQLLKMSGTSYARASPLTRGPSINFDDLEHDAPLASGIPAPVSGVSHSPSGVSHSGLSRSTASAGPPLHFNSEIPSFVSPSAMDPRLAALYRRSLPSNKANPAVAQRISRLSMSPLSPLIRNPARRVAYGSPRFYPSPDVLERVSEDERGQRENAERERLEMENAERERIEGEKAERERIERERAERERVEKEKAEQEKVEKGRAEREAAEREHAEQERIAQEKLIQKIMQERALQEQSANTVTLGNLLSSVPPTSGDKRPAETQSAQKRKSKKEKFNLEDIGVTEEQVDAFKRDVLSKRKNRREKYNIEDIDALIPKQPSPRKRPLGIVVSPSPDKKPRITSSAPTDATSSEAPSTDVLARRHSRSTEHSPEKLSDSSKENSPPKVTPAKPDAAAAKAPRTPFADITPTNVSLSGGGLSALSSVPPKAAVSATSIFTPEHAAPPQNTAPTHTPALVQTPAAAETQTAAETPARAPLQAFPTPGNSAAKEHPRFVKNPPVHTEPVKPIHGSLPIPSPLLRRNVPLPPQKATPADTRRALPQRPREEEPKQEKYCENCQMRFTDYDAHVRSARHREFATSKEPWAELDLLISTHARPQALRPTYTADPSHPLGLWECTTHKM